MSYAFNNFDLIQSHFARVEDGSNMETMAAGSQDDYVKCGCGVVIGAYDNVLEEVSPVGIGHVWRHGDPCNDKFVGEEAACCGDSGSNVPAAMGPAGAGGIQEWDVYSIVPQGGGHPQFGVDEVHGGEAGEQAGEPACAAMAHDWVPPTSGSPPNPRSSSSSSWWADLSTLGSPSPASDARHSPSAEVTEAGVCGVLSPFHSLPPSPRRSPPPAVAIEADQTGEPGASGVEIRVSPPPSSSSGTSESSDFDAWKWEPLDPFETYLRRSAYHMAPDTFCPAVGEPGVDGNTRAQVLPKVLGEVAAVLSHPRWSPGGWVEESGRFPWIGNMERYVDRDTYHQFVRSYLCATAYLAHLQMAEVGDMVKWEDFESPMARCRY
ncbi:hypothetical protein F5J12DRAFT_901448 [Pisolithus orientalis]|uniref:uncharacterized protein n=1 Tax=Pisolithus orientalis TaxID=936130 RepID=UPI002224158A|nr:uncharacterized protein F5J12DRAFT_901525 [Pisolithus orientalis]XP_051593954.1 uncharacterized protein F5J12DRAFT_901448 [Pisolithus orientalis]KAI5980476.1 hypothetical protein F5J12DRAFT_901525 [Pisolithus orientalis]KAI5980521.1 hypothetical protein F5J12DRAFT_901448 [Pisolithus orientalis]